MLRSSKTSKAPKASAKNARQILVLGMSQIDLGVLYLFMVGILTLLQKPFQRSMGQSLTKEPFIFILHPSKPMVPSASPTQAAMRIISRLGCSHFARHLSSNRKTRLLKLDHRQCRNIVSATSSSSSSPKRA